MRQLAIVLFLTACSSANPGHDPADNSSPDGGGGSNGSDGSGTGSGGGDGSGSGGATIWHPTSNTTWQWQLDGTIDTSIDVAVYDIDLVEAPQTTIDTLHAAGRKVICYLSAGTYEPYRPDSAQFTAAVKGNAVDGWPGEFWLDTRSATVRTIMQARLDLAVSKHCDGVEPDNVDGYENEPGFPLTNATQLDYDTFLATEAHARGLSVGLKNDVDQVDALEPSFDWTLNEQCSQYDECDTLQPFVAADKAVFHCEYTTSCPAAVPGFSTILKSLDLDAPRTACP
jgi:hypothetical protein